MFPYRTSEEHVHIVNNLVLEYDQQTEGKEGRILQYYIKYNS